MLITSSDGLVWTGPDSVTVRGVPYLVQFSRLGCDGPCLKLIPQTGYPTEYEGTRVRCGCNYAEFVFGQPVICTGESAEGACGNLLTIRVEWTCTDRPGWGGAGWYCVKPAGSSDPCVAAEMLAEDRCDPTVDICSGPYPDRAGAEAVCPPPESTGACCGDNPAAKKMRVVIDFLQNVGACTSCESAGNGTYDLILGGSTFCQWEASFPSVGGSSCWSSGTLTLRRVGNVEFFWNGGTVGGAGVYYQTTNQTWDCVSPITLSRVGVAAGAVSLCGNGWPSRLTFTPV